MQISKMIDMLLRNIAQKKKVTFIEMTTYKGEKVFKNYKLIKDKKAKEFKNKTEVLLYLKDWK